MPDTEESREEKGTGKERQRIEKDIEEALETFEEEEAASEEGEEEAAGEGSG